MKENDMDAEFFRGLFLYVLIVSSPIIAAWMWKKHQDRKARLNMVRYITFTDLTSIQEARKAARTLEERRQKRRDDHIFNTVEEYRNVSS
jgi:hypothetical protein